MGRGKTVVISFNEEFLGNLKAAAKLEGMNFSEFMRLSASIHAEKVYLKHGLKAPNLNGWHMEVGGDFSDARAAKDKNYKKRTLSEKIDAVKEEAAKRINKRTKGE